MSFEYNELPRMKEIKYKRHLVSQRKEVRLNNFKQFICWLFNIPELILYNYRILIIVEDVLYLQSNDVIEFNEQKWLITEVKENSIAIKNLYPTILYRVDKTIRKLYSSYQK